MQELPIQKIPIARLSTSPLNPRVIRDEKFEKLKTSILRDTDFMYLRPILVNRSGDLLEIYGGNQRFRACCDLGWSEVPCIVEENLSEEMMKARMVKDNSHYGTWDDDKLLDFPPLDMSFLDLTALNASGNGFSEGYVPPEEKEEDDNYIAGNTAQSENIQVGAYSFLFVFASDEEKAKFQMVMANLPIERGQRAEDYISGCLRERFINH